MLDNCLNQALRNHICMQFFKINLAYRRPPYLLKCVDDMTDATTLYHCTLPFHCINALHPILDTRISVFLCLSVTLRGPPPSPGF